MDLQLLFASGCYFISGFCDSCYSYCEIRSPLRPTSEIGEDDEVSEVIALFREW